VTESVFYGNILALIRVIGLQTEKKKSKHDVPNPKYSNITAIFARNNNTKLRIKQGNTFLMIKDLLF
jgi:hypothetical protein